MRLSIIIPVYNVQNYISITLNSLLLQKRNDFEVIIVDDGSKDKSISIAKELIDGKLINWKILNQENQGVSAARNRGILEASGEYILFLDGDDYISEDLVKTVYSYLDKQTPDVICWGYNDVDTNGQLIDCYTNRYDLMECMITGLNTLQKIIIDKNMWIWTGSVAYRRDFLLKKDLKFTEGCANGEDQEFLYKTLSMAKEVTVINEILSYYVQREASISNSYNVKRFDAINAFRRASNHVEKIGNEDAMEIVSILKNDIIISNYLGIYIECIESLLSRGMPLRKAVSFIKRDIEEQYPGLINHVYEIMKEYKTKNFKYGLKIKLYMISPVLYVHLLNDKKQKCVKRKNVGLIY